MLATKSRIRNSWIAELQCTALPPSPLCSSSSPLSLILSRPSSPKHDFSFSLFSLLWSPQILFFFASPLSSCSLFPKKLIIYQVQHTNIDPSSPSVCLSTPSTQLPFIPYLRTDFFPCFLPRRSVASDTEQHVTRHCFAAKKEITHHKTKTVGRVKII